MFDNRNRFILNSELGRIELSQDPMGWDETETEIRRSEKTYGILLTISNNLRFSGSAKEYLERNYQSFGVQAQVKLTKLIKHPQTDEWLLAFTGYLDFSSRKIKDGFFECDFVEGGLREIFTANIREKFELNRTTDIKDEPITVLNPDELTHEGRNIYLLSRLKATSDFEAHSGVWRPNSYSQRESYRPFPLNISANSDPENIVIPQETRGIDQRSPEPSVAHMFFLEADRDRGKTIFNTNINFTVADWGSKNARNETVDIVFDRYDSNLNLLNRDLVLRMQGSDALVGQSFSLNLEKELSEAQGTQIKEGESFMLGVYIKGEFTSNLTSEGYCKIDFTDVDVSISWSEDSFYERTNSPCVPLFKVGERLSEIYTGSPCFESSILSTGKWKDLITQPGGWARNLKKTDENEQEVDWPIAWSWEDFYKTVHGIDPVAYGIVTEGAKQKIVLENIDYFFQRYVTVDLGEIQVEERTTASEHLYSAIITGYTKGGDYEQPLGLDEYNTQGNWITPITVLTNKLELLIPSRADSYGLEDARRKQYKDYPDEDTPYDKDNFIIDAKETGSISRSTRAAKFYEPKKWQDDFEQRPTGVYSPDTAFNLNITPAQNLLRHSKWFKGGIVKMPERSLIYTNNEGNNLLSTKKTGQDPVKENANFQIGKLDRPIFDPEWIKAKRPFEQALLEKIQGQTKINGKYMNNYYGLFRYTPSDTGIPEKAFMFSTKIKNEFEFKLLKVYGF